MDAAQEIPPERKIVLITGCSPGGIGYALARAFHAKGAYTFATARDEKSLADLKSLGIEPIFLEVTSTEQVTAARRHVEERTGGRLDILINNAGRSYVIPALDMDIEEAKDLLDVNLISVVRVCKEFGPLLIKSKGTIVNIGSVAREVPFAFGSIYNASKAALQSYSDTLRLELSPFGVQVVVVVTGAVKSNIARTKRHFAEGSLYAPLEEEYQRRQRQSQTMGIDNKDYAESVARAVLKPHPKRTLWRGGMARLIWFMSRCLPAWFWEVYMWRVSNFKKLLEFHKQATKRG